MRRSSHVLLNVLFGLSFVIASSSDAVNDGTKLLQLQAAVLANTSQEFADDFFEGPEKTLMLKFSSSYLLHGSLRRLPDSAWRDVMQQMGIEILSKIDSSHKKNTSSLEEGEGCVAYLLSESSLFVYDDRVVFKTCGLSSPLRGLRLFLDVARGPAASPEEGVEQVLYSHPAFLRQKEQAYPHRSWEDERNFLRQLFPTGVERRLGTPEHGTDLFAASFAVGPSSSWAVAEIYVTELEQPVALRTFSKESRGDMTAFWNSTRPDKIDEYYFDPSGYSANVLQGSSYSTMHASPQPSVSYLSYATNALMSPDELKSMVDRALRLAPGRHVGVFLFAFVPSIVPTLPMNASFAVDGYAFNATSVVMGPYFQTSLASLTREYPSTCSNEGMMSAETAYMVDDQQLSRCAEL